MPRARSPWTLEAPSPPADSGRDAHRSPGSRLARRSHRGAPRRVRVALSDRRLSLRCRPGRARLPLVDAGRGERGPVDGREPAGRAGARSGARRDAAAQRHCGHGRARIGARCRGRRGRRGAGPRRRQPRRSCVDARRAARGCLLRAPGRRVPGEPDPRRLLPGRGRGVGRSHTRVVGRGPAPRRWRDRPPAVPGPRDRRAAGHRDPRLACGRPRRGPRHRAVGRGGRPRRGGRRPRHDRRAGTDRRRDLEGRLPPAGGTRHHPRRYVPRAVPAPCRQVRAVDRRPARDPRHARRRRVPAPVHRFLARRDRDRDPGGLDHRVVPTGSHRDVRVRGADRRGHQPRVDPASTPHASLGDACGRRGARRLDDRRRAPRVGTSGAVRFGPRGERRPGRDASGLRIRHPDRRDRGRSGRLRDLPGGARSEHPPRCVGAGPR